MDDDQLGGDDVGRGLRIERRQGRAQRGDARDLRIFRRRPSIKTRKWGYAFVNGKGSTAAHTPPKKAAMSRAIAMQCVAAFVLSGCVSPERVTQFERISSIAPTSVQAPSHSPQVVSQAPACQTTYDCCLQRHPLDPEVCAASPTLNSPKSTPRNPPVPVLPQTEGKPEAKRPVSLDRCLDSCAAGGKVLIQFCNDIPDSATRAVCFSKLNESETSCRNFCFNYFGK